MQPRKILKRSEWLLFLTPVLVLGTAFMARPLRLKLFPVPPPTLVPTPVPPPAPNLYSSHYRMIRSIMVSPDGKLIHTGHQDPKAKFSTWNAKSGTLIRRFGLFHLGKADAFLSPDGKIIGFGYGGWKADQLVLFNSATGKVRLQRQKTGHYFALANDVVAMSTRDEMRFFSTKDGRYLYKLRHKASEFFPGRPQFSRDGKLLLWVGNTGHDSEAYANGSGSDELVWFDWKKRKLIHAIQFPQTDLSEARFSGDGKVILATGVRYYWMKGRDEL